MYELQQKQNCDSAYDLENINSDQCQRSILASLVALALTFNSPNHVLIQYPAANKPGAFAFDLEQNTFGFRSDDGYVAQINNQLVAVERLLGLQPRLLEFCDPWLDQLAFENQLALAPGFDGCDS